MQTLDLQDLVRSTVIINDISYHYEGTLENVVNSVSKFHSGDWIIGRKDYCFGQITNTPSPLTLEDVIESIKDLNQEEPKITSWRIMPMDGETIVII